MESKVLQRRDIIHSFLEGTKSKTLQSCINYSFIRKDVQQDIFIGRIDFVDILCQVDYEYTHLPRDIIMNPCGDTFSQLEYSGILDLMPDQVISSQGQLNGKRFKLPIVVNCKRGYTPIFRSQRELDKIGFS